MEKSARVVEGVLPPGSDHPGPGEIASQKCWEAYRKGEMTFEDMRKVLLPYTNDLSREFIVDKQRMWEKKHVEALNANDGELIQEARSAISIWQAKLLAWKYWEDEK